jgi:hypothetical protein
MRVYLAGLKVRDRVNVQEVILTRAKVGLVLLNSQLRIDYANPVAKDIFTRGTTLQHKDQMLYTPHRRENIQLGKMLTEVRHVPNGRATTMSISSSLGEAALSVERACAAGRQPRFYCGELTNFCDCSAKRPGDPSHN